MSNWISVKDRLPEYKEDVTAWGVPNNYGTTGAILFCFAVRLSPYNPGGDDLWYGSTSDGFCEVAFTPSHWMPLPKPPNP